ncbi:hypothetical protein Cni_G24247 [Canna indica]|uniref:Uncharacterized protein n=1 Tax=Canna indica TaxID=4628 RepID=A0AAQ3QN92_9LILI|nr:hypothetical protein Cni_G24247 [Canna indica]
MVGAAMGAELGSGRRCLCPTILFILLSASATAFAGKGDGEKDGLQQQYYFNGNVSIAEGENNWPRLQAPDQGARRILRSAPNSISYRALMSDKAGSSGSRPGNPYTRGCQSYYQCRH